MYNAEEIFKSYPANGLEKSDGLELQVTERNKHTSLNIVGLAPTS